MIYKKIYTFKMPNFEYFKEELGWNIETFYDLYDIFNNMTDDELRKLGDAEINTKLLTNKT